MERLHPDLLPYGFRNEIHKMVTATDVFLCAGLVADEYGARSDTSFSQQVGGARTAVQDGYLVSTIMSSASRLAHTSPARQPPGSSVAPPTCADAGSVRP